MASGIRERHNPSLSIIPVSQNEINSGINPLCLGPVRVFLHSFRFFNHYDDRIYCLKEFKLMVLSVQPILRCLCFSVNSSLFCNVGGKTGMGGTSMYLLYILEIHT